ncbi:MAG: hypothetical protein SU899_03710 [Chloroflexota bacterium]|nr:hypothetical protein [Chloroflexota bacterium]
MNKKKRMAVLKHRWHQRKLKEKRKAEAAVSGNEESSSPDR